MELGPCQSVLPALNPSIDGAGQPIDGYANNGSIDSAARSVSGAHLLMVHNIKKVNFQKTSKFSVQKRALIGLYR